MDCTSPTSAEVKIVARTFAKYPIQSAVDVHIRTAIDLGRVDSLLTALNKEGVLESIELENGRIVYQTLERSFGSGDVFNSIRTFLAPYRAITEEELAVAKEEAKRLEQSILVLKMQLQSHPKSKIPKPEASPQISRQTLNTEKYRLQNEILRIEHDTGKYVALTKLILADLAEIDGISTSQILQSLQVTRTLQELLM